MSDQITPPEEQDPGESRPDLDRIISEAGPFDVVFRGTGIYRPWDLGPGRKSGSRGGFQHANY
jgi:hypothetical protein